ncbi:MAG: 50S ribosomal protein L15 [Melioribacteraceae bacterium]|jgi:large subunit ribosomal protein L15|nr:50S ribosomal protein L15 [Melioribacteraceae bacterium]RJP61457.1 MAG: 50S ribosomal protein L15 [Ignavibacteriales bacterium]WKZ68504.1 MAG: 50S ribosomal protein L15 [Melioribacteraceae bacterium]
MDILSNLKYAEGSRKTRKRVGRGEGSGHGGTATRGMNGQKSRSGAKYRAWFEGGQMPLQRRVPKRGFTNRFRVEYQPINVSTLQKLADDNKLENGKVDAVALYKAGVINKVGPYKILGQGELKVKLEVEANAFSASAKEKIESAGGTIKETKV